MLNGAECSLRTRRSNFVKLTCHNSVAQLSATASVNRFNACKCINHRLYHTFYSKKPCTFSHLLIAEQQNAPHALLLLFVSKTHPLRSAAALETAIIRQQPLEVF